MSMNYTEKMNELMFNQWDNLDIDNEKGIVNLLNDESVFRSFGEGLLALIKKKNPEVNADAILAYIKSACKESGVNEKEIGSVNTLKSWFHNGPRPKKGEDSRESLFALAFALNLTPEETAELFHKVYLDRAFNFRNEKEIFYYFCLANKKTWKDAKRIIESIEYDRGTDDRTLYTMAIKTAVECMEDEQELLSYIKMHRHNLEQNNVTAKKYLAKLIEKAKKYAIKETELPEHEGEYDGNWKKENTISINHMYAVITETTPSTKKGTTTIFKDARLPKEIKNRFPEVTSFAEKEPTYEAIRKMIILLYSYRFWYKVQWQRKEYDIDDYVEHLNALLFECGFSLLYYGNPYDWLFLYCTLSEYPLDAFRGILAESLEAEEIEELDEN